MSEMRFTSTGPQGHRARMRERVLANGAHALADYEILEMLLFIGIPRRDTKPLAKALLQQFGSLISVLRAPGALLREAGLTDDAIRGLRFPAIAAERLAGAEVRARPALGNWEQLTAYLETAARGAVPGQLRLFYLDNRNRLLADEAYDDTAGPPAALRRALSLQATALIGFDLAGTAPAGAHWGATLRTLEAAARPLTIALHDAIHLDDEGHRSYRQEGWL